MIRVAMDEHAPVTSRAIGDVHRGALSLASSKRFVAAGVKWISPRRAQILIRARAQNGRWGKWVSAACTGHDSDHGTSPAVTFSGDPVWTGPSRELQLQTDQPLQGLRLYLVSDAATAGDRHDVRAAARIPTRVTEFASSGETATASGLPLAQPILHAGPGQPAIIARHAWAQGRGPVAPPAYGDVRMGFIHHSDGSNSYSAAQVPQVIRSVYDFHVYTRGWNDIGYNFAIDRFGRIWEARWGGIDQPVVGAQAGGYNLESFGAVVLGTYTSVEPSAASVKALEYLFAWKLALHGVPAYGDVTVEVDPSDAFYTRFKPGQHVTLPRIAGHRDGDETTCPGNDLYARIPAIRTVVKRLAGAQTQLSLVLGRDSAGGGNVLPPGETVHPAKYLSISSVTIHAGQQLPVAGALKTLGGKPVRGAAITLQRLTLKGDNPTVTNIGSATTDADGDWSATLDISESILLRALHSKAPATASAQTVVLVAPAISFDVQTASKRVTVSGDVRPATQTVHVDIRRATGDKKIIASTSVKTAAGHYKRAFTLAAGSYQLRVSTSAHGGYAAGSTGWHGFKIG